MFMTDISSNIQSRITPVFIWKTLADAHEPNMTQISADTKRSTGALHLRKPNNAIWLHDYPESRLRVPSFTLIVWHERTEREGWELSKIHFLDWFRFRGAIEHIISEVGLARRISQTDCLLCHCWRYLGDWLRVKTVRFRVNGVWWMLGSKWVILTRGDQSALAVWRWRSWLSPPIKDTRLHVVQRPACLPGPAGVSGVSQVP